jgi:hypothetical protein
MQCKIDEFLLTLNLQSILIRILLLRRLQPVFKKTCLTNYTVGDPTVNQPQMKKSLGYLQEARTPTIHWGSVVNYHEDEMNPSTTYLRT